MKDTDVYLGRTPRLGRLVLRNAGKVRDIYEVDPEHLLFVTSDRVSAFDVILPQGIPHKGRVLTRIAAHWFARTQDVIPNHLVSTNPEDVPGLTAKEHELLRGRIMLVQRAQPTTVEWVVRGYLAGSGWKEYQKTGTVCGIALPQGLGFCQKLPRPILTPTTKEDTHDLPLTPAEARARVGAPLFDPAERAALALFARGTQELEKLGILLADTKFEFGLRAGKLLLIDEALTPDSSRFWPAQGYKVGDNPPSYDKQVLRDYLETLDWNKQAPGPDLPPAIVHKVSERYLEICAKITGRAEVLA
ncbi:MAG: phosphoribosylaminoimidazolesuccinocarboxamide synthase [Planctomycetes bacterium]|nr:phosphoribosylaminoimidazolesuccinocarboxamide synthase [Planctomycetota bacterium]